MSDLYILEGHKPVRCNGAATWAAWIKGANRRVAKEERDGVLASTVFLGVDHRFDCEGPPILFETMILGGPHDQEQEQYSTWEAAERGHLAMCKIAFSVRRAVPALTRMVEGEGDASGEGRQPARKGL